MTDEESTTLDDQLRNANDQLIIGDLDSEAYTVMVKNYEVLYNLKLKELSQENEYRLKKLELALQEMTLEKEKKLNPNVWINAGASLLGIIMILSYEHTHVLTTKALGFVPKVKN